MEKVPNRGPAVLIVASITLSLTTVAVFLRCYTRLVLQKTFSADDYLILLCQVVYTAYCCIVFVVVKFDGGKHLLYILTHHPHNLTEILKYWWIAHQMFIFTISTVKLAATVFFCSLNPPRPLKVAAIITAVVTVLTALVLSLVQIFECRPVDYFWTRFTPTGHGSCMDLHTAYDIFLTLNTIDIITDLSLAVLPCIMLWDLQMRRTKKLYLAILLGIGGLPTITAIIRATYLEAYVNVSDFSYSAVPVGVASFVEPGIAIFVVSIARLRPLLKKIIPESWFLTPRDVSGEKPLTFGQQGGRPGGRPRDPHDMDLLKSSIDEPEGFVTDAEFLPERTHPAAMA